MYVLLIYGACTELAEIVTVERKCSNMQVLVELLLSLKQRIPKEKCQAAGKIVEGCQWQPNEDFGCPVFGSCRADTSWMATTK